MRNKRVRGCSGQPYAYQFDRSESGNPVRVTALLAGATLRLIVSATGCVYRPQRDAQRALHLIDTLFYNGWCMEDVWLDR
jgi:hypothetical protein